MPLVPGTRIGAYEITSALGEGGMGEVYRARDSKLKRDVALKVLPPEVAGDPERLARFQREAEVLASLNDPHIAQIYGVEDCALVMELVEGDDLAQRTARGPLAPGEALAIARQIVDALEAAHAAGIIHRDLKPANVKVRADGTVKVLDFGLAKTTPAPADQSRLHTVTSPAQTVEGVILGTVAYMSPEQAMGRSVDKRTDIWAFGCVLFEMLSGRRAFPGDSVSETIAAVLKERPPLELLPPPTPPAIVRLLRRCLEKDPVRRLRDIGDARFDLEQAQPGGDDSPITELSRRSRETWIRRSVWALAGAGIGALAVAAYAIVGNRSAPPTIARLTVTPPFDAPLAGGSTASSVTLSAAGQRLIYQSRRIDAEGVRATASQLISRSLGAFEATPLGNLGLYPQNAFMSPDDAWIGLETKTGARLTPVLAKVPAAGGQMAVVCDLEPLGGLRGASWGAGGRIVFATDQPATGLLQVAAAGGKASPITTPRPDQGERDHLWPDVLPGNAGILFTVARTDGTFDIAGLPSGSPSWRTLIRGGSYPRYLAGGHLIYVSRGVLYGAGFDIQTLQTTTDPVTLVENVAMKAEGAADFAVSAGTLAYIPERPQPNTSRFVWLHRDGTTTPLGIEPRAYLQPRLSPDGRRIAVTLVERGTASIWVHDLSRETFMRASPGGESVGAMAWSPDSQRIAFWSDTQKGIFTVSVGGADSPVRVTQLASGTQIPYSWSVDGANLAFVQDAPDINLFLVGVQPPHDIRPLARRDITNVEAAFSPDGKWVAHVAYDGAVADVVVGPVASPERRWPVASGGRFPAWGAGARELLFLDGKAIQRVAVDPATGMPSGRVSKVVDIPAGVSGRLEPSPDGTRFLMLERMASENRPAEIRVVLNWDEEVRAKMAQARPVAR